jgi:hypothetical protein
MGIYHSYDLLSRRHPSNPQINRLADHQITKSNYA